MYGWIWRTLPGPWPVRLLLVLILLAGVLAALFYWVFPWVEDTFDITGVTVG